MGEAERRAFAHEHASPRRLLQQLQQLFLREAAKCREQRDPDLPAQTGREDDGVAASGSELAEPRLDRAGDVVGELEILGR